MGPPHVANVYILTTTNFIRGVGDIDYGGLKIDFKSLHKV